MWSNLDLRANIYRVYYTQDTGLDFLGDKNKYKKTEWPSSQKLIIWKGYKINLKFTNHTDSIQHGG